MCCAHAVSAWLDDDMNMLPCVDGDACVVGVSMVIDSALLLIQIRDGATFTYSICMKIRKHLFLSNKNYEDK